jgi:glutathione peroxidase
MNKHRMLSLAACLTISLFCSPLSAENLSLNSNDASSPLDFRMVSIDGLEIDLSQYKGKVLMMVNVASECGLTPQYDALQAIYQEYHERGLVILGFPANNFGSQEPGTDSEIKQFCRLNYGVTFPMFSKISVKGDDQHPLYAFLTGVETNPSYAGEIRWNFTKFLVGRDGQVVARFESKVTPNSSEVISALERALDSGSIWNIHQYSLSFGRKPALSGPRL